MEHLAPQHVPVYENDDERRRVWENCTESKEPVIAIRVGRRGFLVHYDLQHLDAELSPAGVRELRALARDWRTYPTGTDPISEAEGIGGEAGPVSGALHTDSQEAARKLASRLSRVVFDRGSWT